MNYIVNKHELAKRGNSEKIDWGNNIDKTIIINYRGNSYNFIIKNYIKDKQKVKVEYQNNLYEIKSSGLLEGKIGKIIGKITSDFKLVIGDTIKDDVRDFTIIDRIKIKNSKGSIRKMYKVKCNICGFDGGFHYKGGKFKKEILYEESCLINNRKSCPCCCNNIVVPHINSIVAKKETWWMIPYFKGGFYEAMKYTKNSDIKINFLCPDCGSRKRTTRIRHLYTTHSIGCICLDNLSYPNKFVRFLMYQLQGNYKDLEYKFEYNSKWTKGKFYDCCFKYNNKRYIIEMDGKQHFINSFSFIKGAKSLEEEQANDKYKEELAKNNSYEVIRINCEKSDLDYIKDNIINSKLNTIFDLSNIDWIKIGKDCEKNIVKEVCNYYENCIKDTALISEKFSLNRSTVIDYLKKGNIVGFCNYNKETWTESQREKLRRSRLCKKVLCLNNGKEYISCHEVERESLNDFNTFISFKRVSSSCLKNRPTTEGYSFVYI